MFLSIITINFNDKEGLTQTINSVLSQTFSDFEYIVIDGGSYDGSKAVIEANQDKLSFWVSEPDHGIYNAMNKGIKKAKGDYLLFINSGDSLKSETSLTDFIALVNNDFKDIIYGNILINDITPWEKTYPDQLSFNYLVDDALPHPSTLIRRSCFDSNLYDETLKIVSDWKFFIIGICKLNYSYKHIHYTLSVFNLDGVSSQQNQLVTKERQLVLNTHFSVLLNDYKFIQELKQNVSKLTSKSKLYLLIRLIYRKLKL